MEDGMKPEGNVHRLQLVTVGSGFRFEPDAVL